MGYWVTAGAPREKLVLGIPTYGRSWTLATKKNQPNSLASGTGDAGPITREKGYLAFNEICKNIRDNGWVKVEDPSGNAGPYAYKGNQWVGYDDTKMAAQKARYIIEEGLGGAMFWDLPSDDFRGWCGEGSSPIIRTVSNLVIKQC